MPTAFLCYDLQTRRSQEATRQTRALPRAVSRPGFGRETITISSYSIAFLHPDVFSVMLESQPSITVLPPSSLKNIRTSSENDLVDTRTVGPTSCVTSQF